MKQKQNKGFTIVELLVVIALIAILLILVLVNLNKNRALARDNIRIADIDSIRLALDEYRAACGVYPATLEVTADNGRTGSCSKTLGDFIAQIPTNPTYSDGNNQYYQSHSSSPYIDEEKYMYFGMSNTSINGPCFDYIIGVQLEYGSNNDFNDGEHSKLFQKVNQPSLENGAPHLYDRSCAGWTLHGIPDAGESLYGIYGFRSTDAG